jgi:hypothetical protein
MNNSAVTGDAGFFNVSCRKLKLNVVKLRGIL